MRLMVAIAIKWDVRNVPAITTHIHGFMLNGDAALVGKNSKDCTVVARKKQKGNRHCDQIILKG